MLFPSMTKEAIAKQKLEDELEAKQKRLEQEKRQRELQRIEEAKQAALRE